MELYHHGIKGMRWGIRRFQNKDGSLTPAGEKRYEQKEPEMTRGHSITKTSKLSSTNLMSSGGAIEEEDEEDENIEEIELQSLKDANLSPRMRAIFKQYVSNIKKRKELFESGAKAYVKRIEKTSVNTIKNNRR